MHQPIDRSSQARRRCPYDDAANDKTLLVVLSCDPLVLTRLRCLPVLRHAPGGGPIIEQQQRRTGSSRVPWPAVA
jgi:hypothetical protein